MYAVRMVSSPAPESIQGLSVLRRDFHMAFRLAACCQNVQIVAMSWRWGPLTPHLCLGSRLLFLSLRQGIRRGHLETRALQRRQKGRYGNVPSPNSFIRDSVSINFPPARGGQDVGIRNWLGDASSGKPIIDESRCGGVQLINPRTRSPRAGTHDVKVECRARSKRRSWIIAACEMLTKRCNAGSISAMLMAI